MRNAQLLMTPATTWRRVALSLVGSALLGGVGYLIFELGRYQAGYSSVDAQAEAEALGAEITALQQSNESLRRQIAVFETSREIDQEAYAQVEVNLAELQASIQSQEEELAFYRGIVSPADGAAGLKIEEFELLPSGSGEAFVMRLVLVQAMKHDRRVSGVVKLNVHGERAGTDATLALPELVAEGESTELAYSFRYFQDLERQLILPAGFLPNRVDVELRPKGRGGKPVSQSFDWNVTSG
jgi:hypothetical protein